MYAKIQPILTRREIVAKLPKQLNFQVSIPDDYETAIERVTEALKAEGFGVLTRIDVKKTLKEKLDADFRNYVILGACNPSLAYEALVNKPLIGILLPCNVTVEESNNGVLVSIVNPEAMLDLWPLSENSVILNIAAQARAWLERVADVLVSDKDYMSSVHAYS
jgi:uncharacterized protein (DUF302 family)